MDSDTYLGIGSVALILTFVLLVTVLTYRFEKHMVWQFGEPEAQPPNTHPYTDSGVATATQAGFLFLGWARDLRGRVYQVNHAMWVSRDRTTIGVVAAGVLLVPIDGTCLYTPTAVARLFYRTNSE